MLHEEERLATLILSVVYDAGLSGINTQELVKRITECNITDNQQRRYSTEHIHLAIIKMHNLPIPLLFWIGYQSDRLISADYLSAWTVAISDDDASPLTRFFPRRWLDIYGRRISDLWDAGLKAVVGMILMRPGVSQVGVYFRSSGLGHSLNFSIMSD